MAAAKVHKTDQERAQAALERLQRGDTPTTAQRRALDRVKAAQREAMTGEILSALPKRFYCEASGRQVRTVNDQARRYGIPCDGPTVDIGKILRWIHDTLATHGNKLLADPDEDPLLAGANSPMLEKCRREKWMLLQMERRQKEGELIELGHVRDCYVKEASILRKCAETLERQFGAEPAELLTEAIDDCETQVKRLLERMEARNGETKPASANNSRPKGRRGKSKANKRKPHRRSS